MTRTEHSLALQRAQMPSGSHKALDRRTLEQDNKNLLNLLKAGMTVLDVGCGSGSITSGIAEKAGAFGKVTGIDTSAELISMAKKRYDSFPNLTFEVADIMEFESEPRFDLITSARTLQWLRNPMEAIHKMKSLLKPGGVISVLDYNHEKIEWMPQAPESMLQFYKAFLKWRETAGMNNRIADHLESLFYQAGLEAVRTTDESEFCRKEDPGFYQAAEIWKTVAETRGHQLVMDRYITEEERLTTIREYDQWLTADGVSMKMYLRAVDGHHKIN